MIVNHSQHRFFLAVARLALAFLSLYVLSCSDGSPSDPDEVEPGRSSSVAVSSSSRVVSSSSSVTIASLNAQTCSYTIGTGTPAYGSLACTEKTYKTVTIGTAVWMAENLDYDTQVLGSNQSDDASAEKYCYADDAANCTTDGGLYQWAEAMALPSSCNSASCTSLIGAGHHQGLCPSGWHVPKAAEWEALTTALGATASTVGKMMKLNNTGYSSWDASTNNDGNTSGFSALPAGCRYGGGFYERGSSANFWEAGEYSASKALYRVLSYDYALLSASYSYKMGGFSLRCVMD